MKANKREHGVPGQLNGYVLDVDDECTGKGKHKRCQVSGEVDAVTREVIGVDVTCHLDAPHLAHLPDPTPTPDVTPCAWLPQKLPGFGVVVVAAAQVQELLRVNSVPSWLK